MTSVFLHGRQPWCLSLHRSATVIDRRRCAPFASGVVARPVFDNRVAGATTGSRIPKRPSEFRNPANYREFSFGPNGAVWLNCQRTRRIANILRALDDASRPEEEMNLPGFR